MECSQSNLAPQLGFEHATHQLTEMREVVYFQRKCLRCQAEAGRAQVTDRHFSLDHFRMPWVGVLNMAIWFVSREQPIHMLSSHPLYMDRDFGNTRAQPEHHPNSVTGYHETLHFDVQLIYYSITSDNSAPPDSLSRESWFESKSGSQTFQGFIRLAMGMVQPSRAS